MVKGSSKRIIVVKSPDPEMFEEAIFVVRGDLFGRAGVSAGDVIKEAQKAANSYISKNIEIGRASCRERV